MHYFAPLTPCTLLERSATSFPGKPAVICESGVFSYVDLCKRTRKLMQVLIRQKVMPGDRVAVLLTNRLQSIECHFAVPAAGGVIVMINPWLPENEVIDQIQFSGAVSLLAEASLIAAYSKLFDLANKEFNLIIIQDDEKIENTEALDYEAALENETGNVPLDHFIQNELDPIAINFTSGTTGKPKGVVYSHRAGYLHALGQVYMLELTRKSKYLWTLPMFHVNGWGHMWACVAAACTQILPQERFNAENMEDFTKWAVQYGISHLAGSPRLLRMLNNSKSKIPILKNVTVLTGGAAPSEVLIQDLERAGARLIHQYGLNETCGPFVVCEPQEDWDDLSLEMRARLLGRQGTAALHAGTGLRVIGEDGNCVPPDGKTLGEVAMSGNTVAIEYFNNTEATLQAFRDGWFFTGDMAVVHPDGNLEIRDRRKDLVFVETEYGWENVSSLEIENVLTKNANIKDAAVIGVNLDKAVLVAFVEINDGAVFEEEAFFAYCEQTLTAYKRPQYVFFDALPKTATGKIRKDILGNTARQRLEALSERFVAGPVKPFVLGNQKSY